MIEVIVILVVSVAISLTNSCVHFREYKKVYNSLSNRKVAIDSWEPTLFTGASSWGFRYKLMDIENYFGRENLTDYEIDHIAASRRAHNAAIAAIVFPVIGLVIYAVLRP